MKTLYYLAVDEDGEELRANWHPYRGETIDGFGIWLESKTGDIEYLPKGSIKELINKDLTWADEPCEVKEK